MPFSFDTAKIRVDDVTSIQISDIAADTEGTSYKRLIQIYTDPSTAVNRRPVLELSVYGGDQQIGDNTPLEIAIPGGVEF
jgi:hypothetical protein